MAFGFLASLGSSAANSAMSSISGNLNAINRAEAKKGLYAVDPLGTLQGRALLGEDVYQDDRSRDMMLFQQTLNDELASRAFQRSLDADSSKYQRTAKDLKRAGLNQLLALGGNAQGVSSAAGSVGLSNLRDSLQSSPYGNSAENLMAVQRMMNESRETDARVENLKAQTVRALTLKDSEKKHLDAKTIREREQTATDVVNSLTHTMSAASSAQAINHKLAQSRLPATAAAAASGVGASSAAGAALVGVPLLAAIASQYGWFELEKRSPGVVHRSLSGHREESAQAEYDKQRNIHGNWSR